MATLLANAPADQATLFAECVEDLLLEARNYLDGEPIANEEQANAVSSLINRLRRVKKDADEARTVEKRPHDDAAKAVQVKWKPIIDKADLAATVAKQALAPWLAEIEAKQQREAEIARQEADRLAQIAREAHASASGNLEASEDAERLLKAASAAVAHARKAEKARPIAKGGERGIGLVDKFEPELIDPVEALRHYKQADPEALKEWLLEQARVDVRAGVRSIPGFEIRNERVAK